ncbi:MAG: GNAT family N-acetyltransferase [Candidatus Lariskella arthropodorum]
MTINTIQHDCYNQIKAFISGWSKLRGHSGVSVDWHEDAAYCNFEKPIGRISRRKEFFFWGEEASIFQKIQQISKEDFHFLSVFNVSYELNRNLLCRGYSVLTLETQMWRSIDHHLSLPSSRMVKTVSTPKQMAWYNEQRGKIVISQEQFLSPEIYDYYIEENKVLISFARAINVEGCMVIDDVQTKPEYRRQGLSTSILLKIMKEAQDQHLEGVSLVSSEVGLQLYLKHNFQVGPTLTVYVPEKA